MLSILLASLTDGWERIVTTEDGASEPDCKLLDHVLLHCARHGIGASIDGVVDSHALVKNFLHR